MHRAVDINQHIESNTVVDNVICIALDLNQLAIEGPILKKAICIEIVNRIINENNYVDLNFVVYHIIGITLILEYLLVDILSLTILKHIRIHSIHICSGVRLGGSLFTSSTVCSKSRSRSIGGNVNMRSVVVKSMLCRNLGLGYDHISAFRTVRSLGKSCIFAIGSYRLIDNNRMTDFINLTVVQYFATIVAHKRLLSI